MPDAADPIEIAFREFARRWRARDILHPEELVHTTTSSTRSVTASRNGGALRLVWTAIDRALILEISHGPPDGARAGWLELYRGTSVDAHLESGSPDVDFMSALEYGFDLLFPQLA